MVLVIFWPIVFIITGVMYLLMLLSLPFNPVMATVFLFAIVSFWSRIPGVGIPSPFYILYLLDFVDFFSLIIAINIGGFQGAIFSVFLNLGSRVVGIFPEWMSVVKDTIAQFTVCLIIPFIHVATGGNILTSMVIYSVLRILMFFPLRLLPPTRPWGPWLVEILGAGTVAVLINAFYAKLFGNYFDSLLESGVQFNFMLFGIVTAVVFIVIFTNYRDSVRKYFPPIGRMFVDIGSSIKKSIEGKPETTEAVQELIEHAVQKKLKVGQTQEKQAVHHVKQPHITKPKEAPTGPFRRPPKRRQQKKSLLKRILR